MGDIIASKGWSHLDWPRRWYWCHPTGHYVIFWWYITETASRLQFITQSVIFVGWRRGVVVSGVRRMNEVNARRARLVPGWVTVFGRVCNQPTTGQPGTSAGFWLGGSMPPCHLGWRKFRKFDYEMVHSEVYLNKYVVSIAPFSTSACPAFFQNIAWHKHRKMLFCMFSPFNFSTIFPGGQLIYLPLCADAHEVNSALHPPGVA